MPRPHRSGGASAGGDMRGMPSAGRASGAVGGPLGLQARDLAGREAVHARVVRVVHEVLDRVEPGARARVTPGRALVGGAGLGGGVVDLVARAPAPALERV